MCNDDWETDPDSWKYDEPDDVVQARQEELPPDYPIEEPKFDCDGKAPF
jgi:hypothetical protein